MTDRLERTAPQHGRGGRRRGRARPPGPHLHWALNVPAPCRRTARCWPSSPPAHAAFLMPALEAESARNQTDLPFLQVVRPRGPGCRPWRGCSTRRPRRTRAQSCWTKPCAPTMAALVQDALPRAARSFTEATVGRLRMRKGRGRGRRAEGRRRCRGPRHAGGLGRDAPRHDRGRGCRGRGRQLRRGRRRRCSFRIIGSGGNGRLSASPHRGDGAGERRRGRHGHRRGEGRLSSDITRMAVIGEPRPAMRRFTPWSNARFRPAWPLPARARWPMRSTTPHGP